MIQIPDGPGASPPVAIAHGRSAGWQRYALWIARRDGSVAALCPVVPENAKIDSEELVSAAGRGRMQQQKWVVFVFFLVELEVFVVLYTRMI